MVIGFFLPLSRALDRLASLVCTTVRFLKHAHNGRIDEALFRQVEKKSDEVALIVELNDYCSRYLTKNG